GEIYRKDSPAEPQRSRSTSRRVITVRGVKPVRYLVIHVIIDTVEGHPRICSQNDYRGIGPRARADQAIKTGVTVRGFLESVEPVRQRGLVERGPVRRRKIRGVLQAERRVVGGPVQTEDIGLPRAAQLPRRGKVRESAHVERARGK